MYNLASFDMGKFLLKEQQKPIFTILPTPSCSKKSPINGCIINLTYTSTKQQ